MEIVCSLRVVAQRFVHLSGVIVHLEQHTFVALVLIIAHETHCDAVRCVLTICVGHGFEPEQVEIHALGQRGGSYTVGHGGDAGLGLVGVGLYHTVYRRQTPGQVIMSAARRKYNEYT